VTPQTEPTWPSTLTPPLPIAHQLPSATLEWTSELTLLPTSQQSSTWGTLPGQSPHSTSQVPLFKDLPTTRHGVRSS